MNARMLFTLAWLFLLSLAVAFCCSPILQAQAVDQAYWPSLPRADAGNAAPEAVAERLIEQWLSYHRSSKVSWEQRLANYEVQRIELVEDYADRFIISLSFSVKPALRHSDWMTGSGVISGTGWITEKVLYVTIVREEAEYRIEQVGPTW